MQIYNLSSSYKTNAEDAKCDDHLETVSKISCFLSWILKPSGSLLLTVLRRDFGVIVT